MNIGAPLPFEYPIRARSLRDVDGAEYSRRGEERDRALEDYLASLAADAMKWGGYYDPDRLPYNYHDVVLDGGWTMICTNPAGCTTRPAPQPIGEPEYVYTGTISTTSVSAKNLIFGQRYTFPTTLFAVSYRIYMFAGFTYQSYLVENGIFTPGPIFTNITTTGWQEVAVAPELVLSGETFDIIVEVFEPDPTPTTFVGDWDYDTPNNWRAPTSGEIIHANRAIEYLSISATDDNGGDRTAELAGLTVGDRIQGAGQDWLITSIQNMGGYFDAFVSPAAQGLPTGVQEFTFQTVTPTPISYAQDVNYWFGNQNVSGLFIADDKYENIVPDDTQYGIDIVVQDVIHKDEWEMVAFSG